MNAIRVHGPIAPEGLSLDEISVPDVALGEALVRVRAAGISPAEFGWKIWETADGESRLPLIPSHEISGVVEAVATDVQDARVGEAVYGLIAFDRSGGAAEFVAVPAADLAPKPKTLSHAEAAAVTLSGLTAWQALFDQADLGPGQRVLIHGAAGGVGSFAVQLARWRGAHVVAVASARNHAFVRDLGADEVIDRSVAFEEVVDPVDVVFDTVGGEVTERSWRVLRPGGTLITIVRPPSANWTEGKPGRGTFFIVKPDREDLVELADLIDSGAIRVYVEEVYSLARAREAYERGRREAPRGKLVLAVGG